MLNEKEIRLIKSYYIRLSIVLPTLAGAFLPALPFIVCSFFNYLLGDGVSITKVIWVYPIVAAISVILFSYCALSVRFGMLSKKWKAILSKANHVEQEELDSTKAARANATRAMGNLTGSTAMNVASAYETVSVASEYTNTMRGNIKRVADVFQVKLPRTGFLAVVCILLPSILVAGSFVPVLIGSYHEGNEAIAKREVVFENYNNAFTDMDYGVHFLQDKKSDDIIFNFSDKADKRKYVSIEGNRYGELEAFNVIYPIDLSKTSQENIEDMKLFVKDMEIKFKSSNNDLKALANQNFVELFDSVSDEYTSKETNEEVFTQNESDEVEVSLSSHVDDNPYFYFKIELK